MGLGVEVEVEVVEVACVHGGAREAVTCSTFPIIERAFLVMVAVSSLMSARNCAPFPFCHMDLDLPIQWHVLSLRAMLSTSSSSVTRDSRASALPSLIFSLCPC